MLRAPVKASMVPSLARSVRPSLRVRSAGAPPPPAEEKDWDLMSEDERAALRKRQQAERLRSAEKFMVVGSGEATCTSCGYQYKPENGDPEYPVARGTRFENLPEDWACPVCSSSKRGFRQEVKTIAGFAENQSYGLGTNSMTEGQKSLLIFGSLFAFFALFILGYFLE